MTKTRRKTSPEAARQIAGHARDHVECQDCGARPGQPCNRPGAGRTVHKPRFIAAAIEMKQALRAAAQTLEQQSVLASLPRVPREEIEACRTERGGYSFTRERLAAWGVPWPPPAVWRQALLRGEPATVIAPPERTTTS